MKVITGGQTGADLAGWRAAKLRGLDTGGTMPAGFLAEDGPHPEYAAWYGAVALPPAPNGSALKSLHDRTVANVRDAGAVLLFAWGPRGHASAGSRLTIETAWDLDRPIVILDITAPQWPPVEAARWLIAHRPGALLIAGNRESKAPGIGAAVEKYLIEVF